MVGGQLKNLFCGCFQTNRNLMDICDCICCTHVSWGVIPNGFSLLWRERFFFGDFFLKEYSERKRNDSENVLWEKLLFLERKIGTQKKMGS